MKVGNSQALVLEPGYFYMEIVMIDDFVDERIKLSIISRTREQTRITSEYDLILEIYNLQNLDFLGYEFLHIIQDDLRKDFEKHAREKSDSGNRKVFHYIL